MKRNTVLLAALVAVIGLGVGAWLAFEPASPPRQAAEQTAPETAPAGQAPAGESSASQGSAAQGSAGQASADGGAGQAPAAGAAAPAGEAADTAAAPAAAGDAAAPAFDIVRVEKDGSTVIAGRAEPGAEVSLLDGDKTLAQVTAGSDGSFAVVLDQPLAPGSRTLSLSAANSDGQDVLSSNEVVVVVPQPAASGEAAATGSGDGVTATREGAAPESAQAASSVQPSEPIVVITSREGEAPSTVIQVPGGGLRSGALNIGAVDYDLGGQVAISGKAPVGGLVLVYLDDALIGQGKADTAGVWSVMPTGSVTPGLHRLRVDLLDEGGKVTARVETPFSRAEPIQLAEDKTFVVVQPGNNLWLIARGHYGRGVRYTAIYEANAGQIRDPDLIYPGQIFLIPKVDEGAGPT